MQEPLFADNILEFNEFLSKVKINLPEGFRLVNPFNGEEKDKIEEITKAFYSKYYNDSKKRHIILGSSPARRGSAVTGVPFENTESLQQETGVNIESFHANKGSSDFLSEVIDRYGGRQKFYTDFYMSFVCPLGIVRQNTKGHEVNCNYYESKSLLTALRQFILEALKRQVNFNINTSTCYCIGSGENYKILTEINDKYKLFERIIPLEHPRFIMQYHAKQKEAFLKKYLEKLSAAKEMDKAQ